MVGSGPDDGGGAAQQEVRPTASTDGPVERHLFDAIFAGSVSDRRRGNFPDYGAGATAAAVSGASSGKYVIGWWSSGASGGRPARIISVFASVTHTK